MADFAEWNSEKNVYELRPPLIPPLFLVCGCKGSETFLNCKLFLKKNTVTRVRGSGTYVSYEGQLIDDNRPQVGQILFSSFSYINSFKKQK